MGCTDTRMTMTRFVELHKITADVTYLGEEQYEASLQPMGAPHVTYTRRKWTVTLKRGKRRLTTPFTTGDRCGDPTPADVLACLVMDASGVQGRPFEEWCSDLGYSADSRRAEATYRACAATLPRLVAFLGDLYDAASRAEH